MILQDKTLKFMKKRLRDKNNENVALKDLIAKLNQRLDILADNFGNKTGNAQ